MIKHMSVTYNHVRARELEGTFPGDAKTGVWNSTYLRTMKGWGSVEEELWPYDGRASTWPEPEPPGLDPIAKSNRIGIYQRVNTVNEFCKGIFTLGCAQASFEIDSSWNQAPNGDISDPCNQKITGAHSICLYGYDSERFYFLNSWGSDWGDNGRGSIPHEYLPTRFREGWIISYPKDISDVTLEPLNGSNIGIRKWSCDNILGGMIYCSEIFDPVENEMIAWTFVIEHETSLDIEELFVRPKWRNQGYGSILAREVKHLHDSVGKNMCAWIPHPDWVARNEVPLNKIMNQIGLKLQPSPERWASAIGIES
jgi:GNAT superfamily N-acetyltransferase